MKLIIPAAFALTILANEGAKTSGEILRLKYARRQLKGGGSKGTKQLPQLKGGGITAKKQPPLPLQQPQKKGKVRVPPQSKKSKNRIVPPPTDPPSPIPVPTPVPPSNTPKPTTSAPTTAPHSTNTCLIEGSENPCQCVDPNNMSKCVCHNPLDPQEIDPGSSDRHKSNVEVANKIDHTTDIVFYGDSITDYWVNDVNVPKKKEVFDKYFNKTAGGEFDGVALGISGDQSTHLLWRLQNGELPSNLQSEVFWVTIGTNNFGVGGCSEEVVFKGILRIVEELQNLRPNSIIIINSLLPRIDPGNPQECNGNLFGSCSHKIWDAIQIVNSWLSKYAKEKEKVFFVDATEIFLRRDSEGREYIPTILLDDFLHPSPAGYDAWGATIANVLRVLLDN